MLIKKQQHSKILKSKPFKIQEKNINIHSLCNEIQKLHARIQIKIINKDYLQNLNHTIEECKDIADIYYNVINHYNNNQKAFEKVFYFIKLVTFDYQQSNKLLDVITTMQKIQELSIEPINKTKRSQAIKHHNYLFEKLAKWPKNQYNTYQKLYIKQLDDISDIYQHNLGSVT